MSCSGDEDVRVPPEQLVDVDEELPEGATGADLGDLAPPAGQTFCDAWASTPYHWIDEAVVPLQYWIDSDEGVTDVPPEASEALSALRDHADRRLAWNFKQVEERPVYDEAMASHSVTVADAAVANCPDLPMQPGPEGRTDPPAWWADETPGAIVAMCREDVDELDAAIADYVDRNDRQPGHVMQVEAEGFVAWAYGDGELYVASDYVGIDLVDRAAIAVPVRGGACDL